MKLVYGIYHTLSLVGLGIALTVASGCDSGQTTTPATPNAPTVEPKVAPSSGAVDDLKKDVKPPVVVKPSSPPATDSVPAPKHE
jgi:hypothetical protein